MRRGWCSEGIEGEECGARNVELGVVMADNTHIVLAAAVFNVCVVGAVVSPRQMLVMRQ